MTTAVAEKLLSNIEVTEEGCWHWQRAISAQGYGQLWFQNRVCVAHRISYETFVAPIPDGLTIDHICHSNDQTCAGGTTCLHRRCINPNHLEPVTFVENIMRGQSPPAENARLSRCVQGHEFDVDKRGRRYCRLCANMRRRRS